MSNIFQSNIISTKIKCVCNNCNKEFFIVSSAAKKGKGRFCSRQCNNFKNRSLDAIKNLFWSNVLKTESCWIYNKKPNSRGYGNIGLGNSKQTSAHRFSYEIHFGSIPSLLFVCHTCDNRMCVNPEHLFLGTHQENVTDMVQKKRNVKGENHWSNRLTEKQVKEIKYMLKNNINYKIISNRYGVSHHTIFDIKRNKSWKHIDAD